MSYGFNTNKSKRHFYGNAISSRVSINIVNRESISYEFPADGYFAVYQSGPTHDTARFDVTLSGSAHNTVLGIGLGWQGSMPYNKQVVFVKKGMFVNILLYLANAYADKVSEYGAYFSPFDLES